jgi:hypothetical protein
VKEGAPYFGNRRIVGPDLRVLLYLLQDLAQYPDEALSGFVHFYAPISVAILLFTRFKAERFHLLVKKPPLNSQPTSSIRLVSTALDECTLNKLPLPCGDGFVERQAQQEWAGWTVVSDRTSACSSLPFQPSVQVRCAKTPEFTDMGAVNLSAPGQLL